MTEAQLRSTVANWLVKYVGISEGSSSHLSILKVFNDSKLCTRYKMGVKDSWCATSASAAFIANGLAGAPGSGKLFECVECSCGQMINLAKQQGIWVESDSYKPNVGDLILYDWGDTSGTKDNTGWPDHVGIVISVGTTTFRVIEGNVNDTVGYRTMNVNGKYIRGFVTPKYSKFATPEVVTENKTTTSTTTNKTTTTSNKTSSGSTLNKTSKFKGTVNAKNVLNVRSWAGTSGTKVLRQLKKGVVVDVCDTVQDKYGNDWYYIKESGKYGFVNADYIDKQVTATSKSTGLNKTCKFKGTTTTSLNVRSWAGTEHTKLRTLAKNTTVEVCDEVKASTGRNWYYIKQAGKYGFVNASYIARQ